MFPIFLNADDGMSFESFEDSFLKICKLHKVNGRALAFAFILYGNDQPHIFKILDDRFYWRALHERSGQYLTIFVIRQREIDNGGMIHYMTPVSSIGNPSRASSQLVSRYFKGNGGIAVSQR